ncbi:hypothetical protein CPB86DRAFT_819944 [Serendipita vermifera]|nr:hypothetical protein CPB86DRAFT_819944 [Serendipita vermifera]
MSRQNVARALIPCIMPTEDPIAIEEWIKRVLAFPSLDIDIPPIPSSNYELFCEFQQKISRYVLRRLKHRSRMEIIADMWKLLTADEQETWSQLLDLIIIHSSSYYLTIWSDIPPEDWSEHRNVQTNKVLDEVRNLLRTLDKSVPAIKNKRKSFIKLGQGTRARVNHHLVRCEQSVSEIINALSDFGWPTGDVNMDDHTDTDNTGHTETEMGSMNAPFPLFDFPIMQDNHNPNSSTSSFQFGTLDTSESAQYDLFSLNTLTEPNFDIAALLSSLVQ